MKRVLVAFFLILLAASSCKAPKKEAAQPEAKGKDTSPVLAVVGTREITQQEIMSSLEGLQPHIKNTYLSNPQRLKDYVDNYVSQELIYDEAIKRGLDKNPDILRDIENYKKKLLVKTLTKEAIPSTITDEEIQKFYQEHPDNYKQIKVSLIYIKENPAAGVTKEAALAKATEAREKALSGEDFAELAREYSDDPRTKETGGDMGYVVRGTLPPDIEEKLFSIKEGEVSEPFEMGKGVALVKVTESPSLAPFEKVKSRVQYDLRKQKFQEYIDSIKKGTKVEIYEDRISEMAQHAE